MRTLRQILFAMLMLLSLKSGFAQDSYRAPDKYSVSVNAAVIPSLDLGCAISEQFSLHLKGGYLPNFFKGEHGIDTAFAQGELSLQWWQGAQRFQGFYIELGLMGGWSDGSITKWGITKRADKNNIHLGVESGVGYMWRFGGLGIGIHANVAMMMYLSGRPESDKRLLKIHAPIPTNTGIRIGYFF